MHIFWQKIISISLAISQKKLKLKSGLVNINAHTNLVKFCPLVFTILSGHENLNKILTSVKGHNSVTIVRKRSRNKIMTDGQTDRQNDGQLKSSIAPLFQSWAIIIRILINRERKVYYVVAHDATF